MHTPAHRCTYRVIYGDTDNMGYAYYANYLRWFEIGRTELFRAWGVTYREIEAQGSSCRCRRLTASISGRWATTTA